MKKLFYSLALLVLMLPVFAQTVHSVINVPRDQWGNTFQALLYKPAGYDTSSKKYPLLVFAHGKGEGDATDGLDALYNNSTAGGPSYFIEHNQWPSSFTNPKDGQAYQFIVLTPHARGTSWTYSSTNLDYFLRHMAANYKVDTNRIYITGLSAGGSTIVEYTGHGPVGGVPFYGRYKAAAFVPMSQAYGDPAQSIANNIVADSVRAWGFGDNNCQTLGCDGHGENTYKLINKINIAKAGFGRFTHYEGGHCCWNNFYNPTYRETINGQSMNIYEWMLQFSRAPITTPTANAGPDKTITLPTSSVTLTGSGTAGAGHTISSYTWSRISGPNTPVITSPAAASTTITGLMQGTYVFRLAVKNSANVTATDDVQVTVNPAPTDTVRFLKVRLYGGVNPYTAGGWNNWNINANVSSGVLLYSNGDASNITVTANYTHDIADNLASRASYPTTMCPPEVGRYAAYKSNVDAVFTISGLDNNKKYNLETYNTRDKIGPYTTQVIVGSVTRSIVTDTNYHTTATFTNLTPSNGTIVFTLHRLSTWHYINGFQLTELAGSDSSARTMHTLTATGNTLADSWLKAGWQGSPNPFRDFIVLGATFEKAQPRLTVAITDVLGRVVYTQSFSNIPAGYWNQRLDLSGKVQQRGVYWMRVSGPSLAKPVTLQLLKDQ